MPSVLITGANRGLGLEFALQYANLGWRVYACCRTPQTATSLQSLATTDPDRVSIHPLDVGNPAEISALSQQLASIPIDLLLNNAGMYGPTKMTIGHIDYEAWTEVLKINTLAPMRLVEGFLDNVSISKRKLIACLSSGMGSMAANTTGRHYLYRSSKAALNAVVKSLAIDLQDRQITVVSLHPGWVKTDMGGPDADLEIPKSVRDVIGVIEGLTPADSGRFLNHDGKEIPW